MCVEKKTNKQKRKQKQQQAAAAAAVGQAGSGACNHSECHMTRMQIWVARATNTLTLSDTHIPPPPSHTPANTYANNFTP